MVRVHYVHLHVAGVSLATSSSEGVELGDVISQFQNLLLSCSQAKDPSHEDSEQRGQAVRSVVSQPIVVFPSSSDSDTPPTVGSKNQKKRKRRRRKRVQRTEVKRERQIESEVKDVDHSPSSEMQQQIEKSHEQRNQIVQDLVQSKIHYDVAELKAMEPHVETVFLDDVQSFCPVFSSKSSFGSQTSLATGISGQTDCVSSIFDRIPVELKRSSSRDSLGNLKLEVVEPITSRIQRKVNVVQTSASAKKSWWRK